MILPRTSRTNVVINTSKNKDTNLAPYPLQLLGAGSVKESETKEINDKEGNRRDRTEP
jgi:hypothetical protein